jgi:hypothetical protein
MILFLAVIVASLLVGVLFRGSFRRFEHLRLRWWGLALLGLAIQFVPLPNGRTGTDLLVRMAILSCSYAMLLLFATLNIRLPGMPLVLIGLALNALVIVPNGGMPVSRDALVRSGQGDVLQVLIDEGAAKHHLLNDDDVLTPLADVIPIGTPINQVVSIGDVFVYAGLGWLIVATMRGRVPEPVPEEQGRYRGKHRPGAMPVPGLSPPAEATRSGSAP